MCRTSGHVPGSGIRSSFSDLCSLTAVAMSQAEQIFWPALRWRRFCASGMLAFGLTPTTRPRGVRARCSKWVSSVDGRGSKPDAPQKGAVNLFKYKSQRSILSADKTGLRGEEINRLLAKAGKPVRCFLEELLCRVLNSILTLCLKIYLSVAGDCSVGTRCQEVGKGYRSKLSRRMCALTFGQQSRWFCARHIRPRPEWDDLGCCHGPLPSR